VDLGQNLPLPTKSCWRRVGFRKILPVILIAALGGVIFIQAQLKREKVKTAIDAFKLKARLSGK